MPGRQSKIKGNTFERRIATKLSLWLTGGQQAKLFARNVLSGGQFTQAANKDTERNMPGDLIAAHPAAFAFLSHFAVEVKHNNSLDLAQFLLTDKGYIHDSLKHTQQQASDTGLSWIFIGKLDRKPEFVIIPMPSLPIQTSAATHALFNDAYCMFPLADLLEMDPNVFMDRFGIPIVTERPSRKRAPLTA